MIFDTHSHYDDEAFDEDRDILLSSFIHNNIGNVVAASAEWKSIDKIIKMVDKYDFMHLTLGIHPNNALELTGEHREEFEDLVRTKKPVAIGEIGLDLHWDQLTEQLRMFGHRKIWCTSLHVL